MRTGEDACSGGALEGLTAVVTVRLAEPQFEGQTKEVLGTSAATGIVQRVVQRELTTALTSGSRAARAQGRQVLEKIVSAARTRIAARQHRETQRRKNALEASSLPAKLADCRSEDVDRSELFIVEGDSALGTAKLARSSEFQALLPIRGKILNVQKSSDADMLRNASAGHLQVIGAGSGRSFDLESARVRQGHPDGRRRCRRRAHPLPAADAVSPLMRPMVDAGRVYAAGTAAAPHRAAQPQEGGGALRLHLQRSARHRTLAELERNGTSVEGAAAALKGARRDGRRPVGGNDDGSRRRTLRRVTARGRRGSRADVELLMEPRWRTQGVHRQQRLRLRRSRIDA